MKTGHDTLDEILQLLTSPSSRLAIKETLKLEMDSMKNQTYERLLQDDEEYLHRKEEVAASFRAYEGLAIPQHQRDIIDTLLARKDENNFDYVANAYMAGLLDGYRVLKYFDLTRE